MPNPVMPYADEQDSKHFSVSAEDVAIRSDVEGGYEITRARHTRTPRRAWTSGFTYLNETKKDALETFFFDTVKGGSVIFDWTNPNDQDVHAVRLIKLPTFKYVGNGSNKRWDVTFEVRQV
jgi:hypothetical protein